MTLLDPNLRPQSNYGSWSRWITWKVDDWSDNMAMGRNHLTSCANRYCNLANQHNLHRHCLASIQKSYQALDNHQAAATGAQSSTTRSCGPRLPRACELTPPSFPFQVVSRFFIPPGHWASPMPEVLFSRGGRVYNAWTRPLQE